MKTQFLRRVLYNFAPFILSSSPRELFFFIYRFKRDNFLFEDVFESKTCQYKMASILKEALTQANDVRRVERLVPPSLRNENAEDC